MKTIKQTVALATLGTCISFAAVAWGSGQPVQGAAEKPLPGKLVRSGKQAAVDLVEVPLPDAPKDAASAPPGNPSYAWYNPPGKPAPVTSGKAQVPAAAAPALPPAAPPVAPRPALLSAAPSVQTVDFHREADGGARVVINLPNDATPVKDDKQGNTITLTLSDVDVPQAVRKRMDVMDFGTPVSEVEVAQRGGDARIRITAHEGFEYHTQRNGGEYLVFIDKLKVKPEAQLVGEKKKQDFKGDKLSLNFQDIAVRSVLQLLADFTNKNIVVSDTVQGNITVRLKDVPWDQALDIVLQSKNLAMKENGNVIWVAPAAEMAAKDKQEMEALQAKQQLEPLITEYIPINFAKAVDLVALLEKSKGDEKGKHSLLSSRGTVSVDERTNTLLIQDTATQVKSIHEMVKSLDVPVQQVLIESRIVTADDAFSKNLGSRFGVTQNKTDHTNFTNTLLNTASLVNGFSVNLPTTGATSGVGFSILSKDFMVDLELTALQSESKGEIVSSPRVITSNQTKATIEQGVEIPYQEASSGGASTTSFKKAVLSLEVTPQITPDEHVSMDLMVKQDTVGTVLTSGQPPSINTRQVQTKVLVDNGQTVVLGGVHEEENLKSANKVPVLGDLPLIGTAFRSTNKSNTKRELLIFVTPKIVDPNNH